MQPCLAHSIIQIVHQTNARVRKCTCGYKCSKWMFFANQKFQMDVIGLLGPFVTISNVHFSVFFPFRSAHVERNTFVQRQNTILDLYVFRSRSMHVERNAPSVLPHARLLYAQNRFRSTFVDRIVFPTCSNLFSLYAQICSRSTFVDPNASSTCSNVLSLGARQPKCISHVLKGALA